MTELHDTLNGERLRGSTIDRDTELTFEVPGHGQLHGYVLTAVHYGRDGWYIEWTRTRAVGYTGYWKQGSDGGRLVSCGSTGLHLHTTEVN